MVMFRALSKISAKIYWNLDENIPVFSEKHGNGVNILIKATPPCDLRPAMGLDLKLIRKVIVEYFGDEKSVDKFLPPDQEIILLNKIPYPDLADEIIVEGQVIGHRFFDLNSLRWRFKPLYAGVSRILEDKIGFYAIVDLPRIKRLYIVHRNDIVESNMPPKAGEYVALETRNGLYQGLGLAVRGGRIKILKSWKKMRLFRLGKVNSWYRFLEENKPYILENEEHAIEHLKRVSAKYRIPPSRIFVSFSGGKDSLVTLLISLKAFGKIPVLFNDTGIELPETVEYVKNFAKEYGLELIYAAGDGKFFKYLDVFGPPARDFRWCCKVVKLAPILEAVRRRFGEKPVLSIVGQRKYESIARAFSPTVWVNRWLPGIISTTPIQEWTALEVWAYLYLMNVKVNELYYEGFDRLGCWLCPASEIAEFELVAAKHPDLWTSWENYLRRFKKRLNLEEEWLKYHLWRWKKIPGDQKRLLKKEIDARETVPKIQCLVERISKVKLKLVFKHSFIGTLLFHGEDILPILPIYAEKWKTAGEGEIEFTVKANNFRAEVKLEEDGTFTIRLGKGIDISEIAKLVSWMLVRSLFCTGCKLCVNACPSKALSIKNGKLTVEPEKCTHCNICNDFCPLINFLKVEVHNHPLVSETGKTV